jgi:hypothetical protein
MRLPRSDSASVTDPDLLGTAVLPVQIRLFGMIKPVPDNKPVFPIFIFYNLKPVKLILFADRTFCIR